MKDKEIFIEATIVDITVDEWYHWTELVVLCKDGCKRVLTAGDAEFFEDIFRERELGFVESNLK